MWGKRNRRSLNKATYRDSRGMCNDERKKEMEQKKKQMEEYDSLKKELLECNIKLQKESNDYHKRLQDLTKQKGLTKV